MQDEKDEKQLSRRVFLSSLKKWSKVVIAAAAAAAIGSKASAHGGWINRRGLGGGLNGR